jgi:hypothetical protein
LSETGDPRDFELEQVSSQLTNGLKTCRTILSSYRAMMLGDADGRSPDDPSDSPQTEA